MYKSATLYISGDNIFNCVSKHIYNKSLERRVPRTILIKCDDKAKNVWYVVCSFSYIFVAIYLFHNIDIANVIQGIFD